ncbi:MAG: hypothetical protein RJA99_3308 [Pseudomonadota bacterium]|jgi:DNA (cytosine-5)-methyltransferase 1
MTKPIPVIDLFAGAGGLGEGFSSFHRPDGTPVFRVALSVECESAAHRTLELRAFFREFPQGRAPDAYYAHLRGEISRDELWAAHPTEGKAAEATAWRATLGSPEAPESAIDARISERVLGHEAWVLVGGPPCQAFSMAGRSRNRAKPGYKPEEDHRHFLYREYLRILNVHKPPVFVMENVKGVLSAKLDSGPIFDRMLDDLKAPSTAFGDDGPHPGYRIYSLSTKSEQTDLWGGTGLASADYVVRCEDYGIPQKRHRVLLLGVRKDIDSLVQPDVLSQPDACPTVADAIADLPKLRAAISSRPNEKKIDDSTDAWLKLLRAALRAPWMKDLKRDGDPARSAKTAVRAVLDDLVPPAADLGGEFVPDAPVSPSFRPDWFHDPRLGGHCNHSARSHMPSDFHRYLWASCFAQANKVPIRLRDFPAKLQPKHQNVQSAMGHDNFSDRFKVQAGDSPSTTVMSHIAKDGHYYIHYDPAQCRSLTVREAARLQTFPDNYYFCGNRTEQYVQVGNAVPPLLSNQIAQIVFSLLCRAELTADGPDVRRSAPAQHEPLPIVRHAAAGRRSIADAPHGTAVQAA